jgi:membrane-associated phospholipid phosphatase
MLQAWRFLGRGRLVFAALLPSIMFACVYLSFHYVVDLVAGLGLGILTWALVRIAWPRCMRPLGNQ